MATPIRDQVEARFRADMLNARPEIREAVVAFRLRIFDRYIGERLGDPHFISQLLSTDPVIFRQRLSELLMADWLWRNGFTLSSPPKGHGPDFLVHKGNHRAWLELVTPKPEGLDEADLTPPKDGEVRVRNEPNHERLLRWTHGLKDKREQLDKHIAAGIVKPGDAHVIAINGYLLNPQWHYITGVSQRPIPLELGFGVGARAINWRRDVGFDKQFHTTFRPSVPKSEKKPVPIDTHVFHDPAYNRVSAVLGVALTDHGFEGKPYPSAVVHNPHALHRIPSCWLPSLEHWTGKDHGDQWLLRRHHAPGRRRHR